jgi:hypothetical protein
MSTFLKKELEENGFKVNELTPGLLLVEDFLSQEEIDDFWHIINNTPEEDWSFLYTEGLKTFCMEKFGRDDVQALVEEGKFEITQGWEDKNLEITNYNISRTVHERLSELINKSNNNLTLNNFSFQRMQSGVQLKSHTDQHTDPSIQYATVIYINDDYAGGEVFFEKKDLELRPKPGSLLIFPGNEEFEHGVRHVKNGPIRYVVPGFIKTKDFYTENRY